MNQQPQPGQPGAGSGQPAQAAPGAQAAAGQNRPSLATSQMVERIQLLGPEDKRKYQIALDQLWASFNTLPPDSADAAGVRTRIAEVSKSLMLRVQQIRRQVGAQQAQAQAQTQQQRTGTPQQGGGGLPAQNQGAGTANAAPAAGSGQAGGQQSPTGAGGNAPGGQNNQVQKVPPHIAKHLNEMTIIPPPQTQGQDVRKVQAELRKQYGMALMTMESARNKMQQIDNVIKDRRAKGTLRPEDLRALEQHRETPQKAHDEARKTVENFRQQQEYLKAQAEKKAQQGNTSAQGQGQGQAQGQQAQAQTQIQTQGQGNQGQPQGQAHPQQPQNLPQAAGAPANGNANQQLQNPQTLTASVNTAVEAAKNQAPQMQQNNSQARPQQPKPQPGGQPQQQQVPGTKPDQPHPQPLNTQAAAALAQQSQTGTPTQPSARVQTPQSTTPAPANGRPLSIQAAFHTANERNAQPGTPMANQPASSNFVASANGGATPSAVPSHGHPVAPQQTVQSFPSKMPISKQLPEKATQPPQPVAPSGGAGAGRPTYNGGTGTSGGVVSQPAVPRVPMYIHEAEGEHVLSKKKLDELVRQVCGGSAEGQEENLMAPEVEEVRCSGA